MGITFNSMFGGEVYLPIKLYWCELNSQILERHPRYLKLNDLGTGGYGYDEPNPKYATYIGDLD